MAQGYDIYIITIGSKRKVLPGIRHILNIEQFYYKSPFAFMRDLSIIRKIVRIIRPDILHAHFAHQYGWLGALCGYHPFVLTLWGTDILALPGRSRSGAGKWLTRLALTCADAVTVTSVAAMKAAVALGADDGKTHVIFWGVDTQAFRPDIDASGLRQKLGIAPDAQVILSNRSFAPLYNNDIIISAMPKVLSHFPGTILVLQDAGEIPGGENELRKLAASLSVIDSVRFLPRFDHRDLPPLYAMSDIYVSVPSWDAGPVSLKEAMAAGCAPVISEVPGPMEWVQDEYNGLVVPPRDAHALADALCRLLADENKRRLFAEKSRELVCSKGDHLTQMKRAEQIYIDLAANRGKKTISGI